MGCPSSGVADMIDSFHCFHWCIKFRGIRIQRRQGDSFRFDRTDVFVVSDCEFSITVRVEIDLFHCSDY